MLWNSFNSKYRQRFRPERLYRISPHILSDKPLVELWMRKPSGTGCTLTSGFWSATGSLHPWTWASAGTAGVGFPFRLFWRRDCILREWAGEQRLRKWWRGGGGHWFCNPPSQHQQGFCLSGQKWLCGVSAGSDGLPGAWAWGLTMVAASYICWGLSVQEVHLLVFCICVGSKFPPLRN